MVNLAARIWRTAPGPLAQEAQTVLLGDLFRAGADRLTDPRVLYDAPSGRWFASISDVDASTVLLAVSRGGDPTAPWSTYSFAAAGCADQPRLGIADGIVVLAADVFSSCDEGFSPVIGAQLWVVNKGQLVAGAASVASSTYGPDRAFESLAPVQSLSSTSTEYVVSVDVPSSRVVHLLTVDGIPPAAVRVQTVASIPVSPLSTPPPAQQPLVSSGGRQPTIRTNDDRVLDSVWENGTLWLSANTGCVPPGDTLLRSCARVVGLETATRTLSFDTNVSQPGAHLFYPALRPDGAGNLVIVCGESSVAVQPALVAIGRLPDGSFTQPSVIAQSAGPYVGGRFGDYFGAARDPSQPGVVWVAGEQGVEVAGARGWSSTVASVQLGTPAPPPEATGSAPPALRAQAASGRAGAAVRLADEALGDGESVRAKVTVRAQANVVFSTTTQAGPLRGGQAYSVLWHPARKLRGKFSWCVVAVGAGGTQSAQNCASVSLR
jgi:hypothetical protein